MQVERNALRQHVANTVAAQTQHDASIRLIGNRGEPGEARAQASNKIGFARPGDNEPLADADPFAFATTFAIELVSVPPLVEFTLDALTIAYSRRPRRPGRAGNRLMPAVRDPPRWPTGSGARPHYSPFFKTELRGSGANLSPLGANLIVREFEDQCSGGITHESWECPALFVVQSGRRAHGMLGEEFLYHSKLGRDIRCHIVHGMKFKSDQVVSSPDNLDVKGFLQGCA